MKLKHKIPCQECPWRKDAPKGWLGGHSPYMYADAVQENEVPACHLSDFGPDDGRTAMCAGALSTIKSQCISPYKQPGGQEAANEVGTRPECFDTVFKFYEYHAGAAYTIRALRPQNTK